MTSESEAPVRVVLFDLDDTLFRHSEAVAAGVLAHRRAHGGSMGSADDTSEFERWHDLEELHYHRYLSGEVDFLEQRRARARDFVAPFGVDLSDDATADEWFGRYLGEYRRAWELHPDAVPALDEISLRLPEVRFGIITNAVLSFQTEKLDALELSSRMEHVVASAELGVAKPDRRIFTHACGLFGVEPSEAVYVGDRLETDAIGAASAGLTGVWLLRGRGPTPAESVGIERSRVHVVSSLADLAGGLPFSSGRSS